MAIHIGEIIKNLVKSKGVSVTDFANKINYSRRNVYSIFEKRTMDTGLLIKISKILNENLFFKYLTEEEITSYKNDKTTTTEVISALKEIKASMDKLNKKKKPINVSKKKKAIKNNTNV